MNKNTKLIRITKIKDFGRNHNLFCDKTLLLRQARRVGDTETINHYQYSVLKRMKGSDFDFEEL